MEKIESDSLSFFMKEKQHDETCKSINEKRAYLLQKEQQRIPSTPHEFL